ncbi:MAG: hypothetical protein A2428_10770 [Bdellovibrionales bacterium RIFOXYC1_FULL_54_43]|nr:MAG: hypothetical protein A2428_10770 [Bdellovibrionales bacterium RIFOXYC1_FULL_54_43]OFZ78358.1 MAG: hypothetical protein A2603_12535 [Bdellovibrionales bacterium RIFOXYD1_FULL_55_31]
MFVSRRLLLVSSLLIAFAAPALAAQFTVDQEPPTAPAHLKLSFNTVDYFFYLNWKPSTDNIGVTAYRLYRNGELLVTTSKTSYLDMEYEPAIWNSYHVTAIDAAGNESAASETVWPE